MYFPYFRGKQNELAAIRQTATSMARSGITPIIEPVRAELRGLGRTLDEICKADSAAIVIVNPVIGDLSSCGDDITRLLGDHYLEHPGVSAGLLLTGEATVASALQMLNDHVDHSPVFIHAGFLHASALAAALGDRLHGSRHVFFEGACPTSYRRHFAPAYRVLLRDGFNKRKNADHPAVERFSDLHLTYADDGLDGFGDFLVVGDEYSEKGGPAYAVAIHLTFIDPDQGDEMFIYHFISDRVDTPTDTAGKFEEALAKLATAYDSGRSKLHHGEALAEFLDLHERVHFPGLGYAKKLSMIHHIETFADHLG